MSCTYFGPPWPSAFCDDAEQVATPVGVACSRCGEVFIEGDSGAIYTNGPAVHKNCFIRSLIGSAGHIERCFGLAALCDGTCPGDDPNLTIRQAADLAVQVWEDLQRRYPHEDEKGMRWRMEGARPVSRLADIVAQGRKRSHLKAVK